MAVSAGMTGRMVLSALWTVPELTAGFRRTAARQVVQYLPMRRRHARCELLHVRRAVTANDIGQSAHLQIAHEFGDLLSGSLGCLHGHVCVSGGGAR